MHWRKLVAYWLTVTALTAITVGAEFRLNSGEKISGELSAADANGFIIRLADGTYSPRYPWLKMSDESLESLKDHPKAKKFVEPLIMPPPEEGALKQAKAGIKLNPTQMPLRPEVKPGWITALTAPPGLLFLAFLYLANLYTAFEIAKFKWRPGALVCGLAAVLPVIGPIIFLVLPRYYAPEVEDATKMHSAEMKLAVTEASGPSLVKQMGIARTGSNANAEEVMGGPRTFTRANYTFNRKFLEGQLGGFLKPQLTGPDAGMVLDIVHGRGTTLCQRVARLTMNDAVFLDAAGKEVPIEYSDLKEIHIRPA